MEFEEQGSIPDKAVPSSLPFPPLSKEHIMHCSYHDWYPRYRAIVPKSRLVPLSKPFITYLKADGIILPPDEHDQVHWDSDSGIFSSDNESEDSDDDDSDPSTEWSGVHYSIKDTIAELGGKVVPKLNWSAPKDATWMNPTNSMECRNPNDIYLLLKASDFVTHDLEHAFDGCVDRTGTEDMNEIPYHLVLRKHFMVNPALEFRCFVRQRKLIAICQRDLNHFDFLFKMLDDLKSKIQLFFDLRLRETFPDPNFAFDVYIPPPHDRVWLVDINPWAIRTDPLLFSWLELLTMPDPLNETLADAMGDGFVRLSLKDGTIIDMPENSNPSKDQSDEEDGQESSDDNDDDDDVEEIGGPDFRLIRRDDPEAYTFNTPQYSAHKLPKDVVDASTHGPESLREFTQQWKEAMAKHERGELHQESSDSGNDG